MNTVLLRLLSTIRYREITSLIGQDIFVSNFEQIRDELTQTIHSFVPDCGGLESSDSNITGALAKYSILDLQFLMQQNLLSRQDSASRKMLSQLGFLGNNKDRRSAKEVQEKDPTCIESLLEAAAKGKEWLLVFLDLVPQGNPILDASNAATAARKAGVPDDEVFSYIFDRAVEALPSRFPARFRIVDACITNSDFIWVHKHFYL
jgi:hypothetical protein